MKKAIVIAVGSELVEGITLDTNSPYISRRLMEIGYVVPKTVKVDDDFSLLKEEVKRALEEADLVVTTGGLGPTEDDITREAVAEALKRRLLFDEGLYKRILERLRSYLGRFPESIRKEAMVIEGARVLENNVGSAPGQLLKLDEKFVLLLPGPPSEMKDVLERALKYLETGSKIVVKTLRFYGVRESILEDDLRELIYSSEDVKVATQADFVKGVSIRFTTSSENKEKLKKIIDRIKNGPYSEDIYAEDDTTMEESVVELLKKKNLTLGTAESCTGGLLASTLVNVPGASKVFKGGIIAYDNSVKVGLLGVSEKTLKFFGAVSSECVQEMSEGLRKLLGVNLVISISGIAGPEGGSEEKPVGLVYIDVYDGKNHVTKRCEFGYDRSRNTVRMKSVMTALDALRRRLLDWRDVP